MLLFAERNGGSMGSRLESPPPPLPPPCRPPYPEEEVEERQLPNTRNISDRVVLFRVAMDCASAVGRIRTESRN